MTLQMFFCASPVDIMIDAAALDHFHILQQH